MSWLRGPTTQDTAGPIDSAPVFFDARREFAKRFVAGHGLEIGALHLPLPVPSRAHVRFVDRMSVEKLRSEYSELATWNLTPVDVIDDGELLGTIPEESQDFIIANHFLEHCEDPIRTIETHLGKLKPGGVLFYAVPDKRYTFDHRRPLTPLDHIVADHEQGPERSRREHYEEWSRLVSPKLEDSYSIHMHVWTQAEFLEMILHCRERFGDAFDIEAASRHAIEFIVVLRKAGPPPVPSRVRPALGSTSRWRRRRWGRLARREVSRLRNPASRSTKRG
jgi:SAM-dependent methyltransferase